MAGSIISTRATAALRGHRESKREWNRRVQQEKKRADQLQAELDELRKKYEDLKSGACQLNFLQQKFAELNADDATTASSSSSSSSSDTASSSSSCNEKPEKSDHNIKSDSDSSSKDKGCAAEEGTVATSISESSLEILGSSLYQDGWDQGHVNAVIKFDTSYSCRTGAMTEESLARMPGIVSSRPMTTGLYHHSLSIKGLGYTLVGLVSTDAEKKELSGSLNAKNGFEFPHMKLLLGVGRLSIRIHVDMVNRRARLFIVTDLICTLSNDGNFERVQRESGRMQANETWENLPDKVWLAVAIQRNSTREVLLLPSTHWEVA